MTVQDQATSSVNDTGTNGKIDAWLTHSGSGFDLEAVRQQLIAMRVKHGANTPIGNRCSNLVELLQNTRDTAGDVRKMVDANIMRQMADLQRLVQAK